MPPTVNMTVESIKLLREPDNHDTYLYPSAFWDYVRGMATRMLARCPNMRTLHLPRKFVHSCRDVDGDYPDIYEDGRVITVDAPGRKDIDGTSSATVRVYADD